MSWDKRQAIIEARKCAQSANNTNVTGGQDNKSTIAGPPTTINVANGVDKNNGNNCQANTTTQANQGGTSPGTMIQNMMSSASTQSADACNGAHQDEIMVNGTTYRSVNATVQYRISQQANNNKSRGALIDGGANGGLLGDNVQVLEHVPNRFVNITGVAGNELTNLKLAQAAALVQTMEDGLIVVIMLQCANCGIGQTVHSKGQMEHFGVVINNKSKNAGSKQCIVTPEGCTIPIHVRDGLPCIDMCIPMDADLEKCPHVFLTADSTWDPSALDNEFDEQFCDAISELPEVKEQRDGADPCIDDCDFLRT